LKKAFCVLGVFLIFISCQKEQADPSSPPSYYDTVEGEYTGVQYFYKSRVDFNLGVFYTYDTTYNLEANLEIKEDSNLIRFGGLEYHHMEWISEDTLYAFNTTGYPSNTYIYPQYNFYLLKSMDKVIVTTGFSHTLSPTIIEIVEVYDKD